MNIFIIIQSLMQYADQSIFSRTGYEPNFVRLPYGYPIFNFFAIEKNLQKTRLVLAKMPVFRYNGSNETKRRTGR